MRFLIDMPLSPTLAQWLSEQGHDAVHASSVGLAVAADAAILEQAVIESRIIVTADLDYPRLLALNRASSPAVVLFRKGQFSELQVRARLERLFGLVSPEEMSRSLIVIERARIRRRQLPIKRD